MERLNDAVIRQYLIQRFESGGLEPFEIMQELHVCGSQAIADVVTLRDESHCYEIKGETDKVQRILAQGAHYNKAFRRITLVTTANHLNKALQLAPPWWGIMLAKQSKQCGVVITSVRKDKVNPEFDSIWALYTLWKDELLQLLENPMPKDKRRNMTDIATMIAENNKKLEVSKQVAVMLSYRHKLKMASDYKFVTYS
ncbi:sce7726 family protein [Thiomicrorhabdus lithotrophica]|uniref:Sce7726 family protein n=1 Tax=Thiomicrorhabdus lithotrophica TaxID=2949997 RepID=A0ABY8CC17_9GAMM|nr:sce7726 family protein [Thiomicrorhabdus lithotrophica]WEJ61668.1 sce7726 family protein [Thiomicrorhabdus lithotrophica]